MSKLTLEELYHDLKDKQVKLNGDLAELDFATPIQGFSLTTERKRHMVWNNFIITKSKTKPAYIIHRRTGYLEFILLVYDL